MSDTIADIINLSFEAFEDIDDDDLNLVNPFEDLADMTIDELSNEFDISVESLQTAIDNYGKLSNHYSYILENGVNRELMISLESAYPEYNNELVPIGFYTDDITDINKEIALEDYKEVLTQIFQFIMQHYAKIFAIIFAIIAVVLAKMDYDKTMKWWKNDGPKESDKSLDSLYDEAKSVLGGKFDLDKYDKEFKNALNKLLSETITDSKQTPSMKAAVQLVFIPTNNDYKLELYTGIADKIVELINEFTGSFDELITTLANEIDSSCNDVTDAAKDKPFYESKLAIIYDHMVKSPFDKFINVQLNIDVESILGPLPNKAKYPTPCNYSGKYDGKMDSLFWKVRPSIYVGKSANVPSVIEYIYLTPPDLVKVEIVEKALSEPFSLVAVSVGMAKAKTAMSDIRNSSTLSRKISKGGDELASKLNTLIRKKDKGNDDTSIDKEISVNADAKKFIDHCNTFITDGIRFYINPLNTIKGFCLMVNSLFDSIDILSKKVVEVDNARKSLKVVIEKLIKEEKEDK